MHISYSEIKNWSKCPYYHKLTYIDGLKHFKGNLYTAFGSALHTVCEKVDDLENSELVALFKDQFKNEVRALEEHDEKFYGEMLVQGTKIIPYIKTALADYFGDYKILSVEENLYESIWVTTDEKYFKGYVDLVLQVGDTIHILDWKTTTRGWNDRKRGENITKYQLLLYKYYYGQKHGCDLNNIKVHFGLLNRTLGGKKRVELYEVESERNNLASAINYMKNFLYNVKKENFIKNRLSCRYCEFKDTEHCP